MRLRLTGVRPKVVPQVATLAFPRFFSVFSFTEPNPSTSYVVSGQVLLLLCTFLPTLSEVARVKTRLPRSLIRGSHTGDTGGDGELIISVSRGTLQSTLLSCVNLKAGSCETFGRATSLLNQHNQRETVSVPH